MIPWDQFENQLSSFFKSQRAQSEKEAADYMSDKYDSYAKLGKDQYGNGIQSANKDILKTFFLIAFNEAKSGKPLDKVSKKMMTGIVLYWRSAKMSTLMPPPTSVSVVTNIIVLPGIPLKFAIRNSTDSSILAKNMILAFKSHAKTITGVNTALVPTPTGAQIPTPFAWRGIT